MMQTQPGGLVTFLPLRSWERRTRPSWPMTDTWDLERTAEALFVHGEIDLAAADSFEERASEAVMDGPGVQRPHRPLWSDVHGLRGDACAHQGPRAPQREVAHRPAVAVGVQGPRTRRFDRRCAAERRDTRTSLLKPRFRVIAQRLSSE